jgi:GTPase involved in cell partitioning and DNA repair
MFVDEEKVILKAGNGGTAVSAFYVKTIGPMVV